MKLIKKNISHLVFIILFCFFLGSLTWELFERILSWNNIYLDLAIGPIGFDLDFIRFWIKSNPGSLAGIGIGIFIFNKV